LKPTAKIASHFFFELLAYAASFGLPKHRLVKVENQAYTTLRFGLVFIRAIGQVS
jgi:hypothetical protein